MTKSEDLQPRLLHPARLAFKIEGKIKSFPDKEKLKDFVTTKPVLQQMLKGLLEEEEGEEEEGEGEEETEENGLKIKWQ